MRTRLEGLLALACLAALVVVAPDRAPDAPALAPAEYDYLPQPATALAGGLDVLADEVHGQVFVAQQRAGLLVTDLDGAPITTIPMTGAQYNLSLSDDGSTLYAEVLDPATSPEIVAVDTTTYAVAVVADSTYGGCPIQQVEQQAGLLWFTTSCGGDPNNDLGYIDPEDGSLVGVSELFGAYVLRILAVPGEADRLLLVTHDGLELLEINPGAPATVDLVASSSYAGAVAATPDGEEIFVADYFTVHRLSADDLSPIGSFNRGQEVTDLAVRDDGVVAVGVMGKDDIALYAPGATTRFRAYEFGDRSDSAHGVGWRDMAWGGDRLFAIVGRTEFYAFTPRRRATLVIEQPKGRYRYGEEIPLKISMQGPDTAQTTTLWSVDGKGVRRRVADVRIRPNSTAAATVLARRSGHFEVTYPGNDRYDPAFDKAPQIWVKAGVQTTIPSGRSIGEVRVHRVDQVVKVRAKVLPDHARDKVEFRVGVLVGRRWRHSLARWVRLSSDSRAGLDLRGSQAVAGHKFRVRLEFYGDQTNTESFSKWRYFTFVR